MLSVQLIIYTLMHITGFLDKHISKLTTKNDTRFIQLSRQPGIILLHEVKFSVVGFLSNKSLYDFVPEAAHKKGTPESKIKF
jgi:hypothetical protein